MVSHSSLVHLYPNHQNYPCLVTVLKIGIDYGSTLLLLLLQLQVSLDHHLEKYQIFYCNYQHLFNYANTTTNHHRKNHPETVDLECFQPNHKIRHQSSPQNNS